MAILYAVLLVAELATDVVKIERPFAKMLSLHSQNVQWIDFTKGENY